MGITITIHKVVFKNQCVADKYTKTQSSELNPRYKIKLQKKLMFKICKHHIEQETSLNKFKLIF